MHSQYAFPCMQCHAFIVYTYEVFQITYMTGGYTYMHGQH